MAEWISAFGEIFGLFFNRGVFLAEGLLLLGIGSIFGLLTLMGHQEEYLPPGASAFVGGGAIFLVAAGGGIDWFTLSLIAPTVIVLCALVSRVLRRSSSMSTAEFAVVADGFSLFFTGLPFLFVATLGLAGIIPPLHWLVFVFGGLPTVTGALLYLRRSTIVQRAPAT